MSVLNPEQYASKVEAELVKQLRHSGKRPVSSMPRPDVAARLILETLPAPGESLLAKRIGPVWSSARTREVLGLGTRQALNSRRAHGTVLGIKTREGAIFYPIFQFLRRGETAEVHPNLVSVLKILKEVDSWTVAAMLQSDDPDLGMSAIDWVNRDGDQTTLEEWASTVQRELTSR